MKKEQMMVFPSANIVAWASLVGGDDVLKVNEQGLLVVPEGVEPTGFNLTVAVKEDDRTFIVQKNVGTTGGDYSSRALSELKGFAKGWKATVMVDPIEVIRAGGNVWTGWHKNQASNRVDCWHLGKDGKLDLFQIAILTHNNGKTWHLVGEYRWRGQLYQMGGELVGLPEISKWGSLEGGTSKRTQIFGHPDFTFLLKDVKRLMTWDGAESEVNPPLPEVPEGQFAVVDWFIPLAGQTGQGIVLDQNGKSAWVHGLDIEGFNPTSFEPLLWHGDIISYTGVVMNWGSKKNGPPKLTGVKLVKRAW